MYVANPITRKIQAIKITPDGPRFQYRLLGDFVQSSDEWFRPVAITFGPDGCLYIVDWYNKIISHNEVPRNHPERDKTRGRIWRVKHKDQKPFRRAGFHEADRRRADRETRRAIARAESSGVAGDCGSQVKPFRRSDSNGSLRGVFKDDNAKRDARRVASGWALRKCSRLTDYEPLVKLSHDKSQTIFDAEAMRIVNMSRGWSAESWTKTMPTRALTMLNQLCR